jgi:hypothetical protein
MAAIKCRNENKYGISENYLTPHPAAIRLARQRDELRRGL